MHLHTMKLLTIVAEQQTGIHVIAALKELGIRGYTFQEVKGEGEHGACTDADGNCINLQIEVIASLHMMDDILEMLQHNFMSQDTAIIAYVAEVKVFRHQKFM